MSTDNIPPESHKGKKDKEDVDQALLDKALELVRTAIKGNGINPESVSLESFEGEIIHFEAYAYFKIDPQIAEKRLNGRKNADKVVGSVQEMRNQVQSAIEKISENPVVRKNTIDMLLHRNDLGFGIDNQAIMLDSLNKTIAVHESCTTCNGSAYIQCPQCHGFARTVCIKCHGTREANCQQCQGRLFISGQNGQQTTCPTCNGRGKTRCLFCHGTGQTDCKECKSTGKKPCNNCHGTGWHSLITYMKVLAHSRFDYYDPQGETGDIPEDLFPLLKDLGPLIVMDEHADVRIIEDQEHDKTLNKVSKKEEYVIPYYVRVPWGDIKFKIKDIEVEGKLFGFNPVLLEMPTFMEKIVGPGIRAITEAAKTPVKASNQIKNALRYRFIAETLITSGKNSHKKAFALIKKQYPFGFNDKTIHHSITAADKALKHITLKPRMRGLAIGLLLSSFLYGLYYIGPVRTVAENAIPSSSAQGFFDLLMVIIGGACTTLSIQLTAIKSLYDITGKILPPGKRKKLLPKAGRSAVWGYAGGFVIYFTMLLIAYETKGTAPSWFIKILS